MDNFMPTYGEFVKFCKAQPPGRTIDHSHGWESCAVGDFIFESVIGFDRNSSEPIEHKRFDMYYDVVCNFVSGPLDDKNEHLRRVLGNPSRSLSKINTYGDLVQNFL